MASLDLEADRSALTAGAWLRQGVSLRLQQIFHPRPEWSWACGPSNGMKMASVQQPLSMEAPPSPLSSRAEGSAVPGTLLGNVFRPLNSTGNPGGRDLRLSFLQPQETRWHQCSLRRVLATRAGRPAAATEPFRKPNPHDSRTQSWVAIL
jgi:hypothetical protein